MKRLVSALTVFVGLALPAAAQAQYIQIKPIKNQEVEIQNISTGAFYVGDIQMQDPKEGTLLVSVETTLQPGQMVKKTLLGGETTPNTRLVRWDDGKNQFQQGVRICFVNAFGYRMFQTPQGQAACR